MKSKGFTLIELLVVVAIIGVLATLVITALGNARERARDARRESDIKTIQNALEMYYIDHGRYPVVGGGDVISSLSTWSDFETILGQELPVDPINNATDRDDITDAPWEGYGYWYASSNSSIWCNNQAYMLVFNKETSDGTGPEDGLQSCGNNYTYGDAFVVGVSPHQ